MKLWLLVELFLDSLQKSRFFCMSHDDVVSMNALTGCLSHFDCHFVEIYDRPGVSTGTARNQPGPET
jgi:hypothetical protein